jgi:hypothetical protein
MTIILNFLTAMATALGADRQAESDALRQTAPAYLTTQAEAAQHLAASTFAGELFSVDPTLLLAIAYRESRYTLGVTGAAVRGRHACGLLQPQMHQASCDRQTILGGYLEGAEHLRVWMDTKSCHGDITCALLGYAGGYALLKGCAAGPVVVERGGKTADLCTLIPRATTSRARRIRTRLQGASS